MSSASDAPTIPARRDAASVDFGDFARSRAILLTTYRRNGEVVAIPVWLVVRIGLIYVTTPAKGGKVK